MLGGDVSGGFAGYILWLKVVVLNSFIEFIVDVMGCRISGLNKTNII